MSRYKTDKTVRYNIKCKALIEACQKADQFVSQPGDIDIDDALADRADAILGLVKAHTWANQASKHTACNAIYNIIYDLCGSSRCDRWSSTNESINLFRTF